MIGVFSSTVGWTGVVGSDISVTGGFGDGDHNT